MSASSLHGDALLRAGQLVLVELQAVVDGPLPHGDVVLLAAGEVVQGEGELLVADDAQVGVHEDARCRWSTAGDDDARLGVAVADDLLHAAAA